MGVFAVFLFPGWVNTPYHEWAGALSGGPGRGRRRLPNARRYRPGFTIFSLQFPLPAGGDKSIAENTTAAAAAADAGVVFYNYGCHRFSLR